MLKVLYTAFILVLMFSLGQVIRLNFLENKEPLTELEIEHREELRSDLQYASVGSVLIFRDDSYLLLGEVHEDYLFVTDFGTGWKSYRLDDALAELEAIIDTNDDRYEEFLLAFVESELNARHQAEARRFGELAKVSPRKRR